jgi:lipoprotein-anchoring transpeptidase ErfK/SrfK
MGCASSMMVILGGAEMISRIIVSRIVVSRIAVSHIIAGVFTAIVLAGTPAPANAQGIFGWLFAQRIPREVVAFPGSSYAPGTIVISTSQRRLYLVMAGHQALRYGIGVGREGFTWSGTAAITAKREWPDWTPPEQMLQRKPELPRHMAGGPNNPLGARAMYLGDTLYRIHGSNEPETIGTATSSGCIRLTNDDVIDLYSRVHVGTTVVVLR